MDAADLKRLKAAGMIREGRTVGEALARVAEQEAAPRAAGESFIAMLPWPPSVNHYYGYGVLPKGKGKRPYLTPGGKLTDGYIKPFLTDAGRQYRRAVVQAVGLVSPLVGPVSAEIVARPPDRLRRDLDNLLKCVLDSLQHAAVLRDDTQIRRLSIEWGRLAKGGAIVVRLTPIPEDQPSLFKGDRS